jgi:putative ABC transport system ATP-binding protein
MTEDMAQPIVVLKDVKKTFDIKGRSVPVPALRGVTMEIPEGAMVAIKGPSGSGKTTLLQIIGALDVPTSGQAVVDGADLADMDESQLTEYRAATIGFVFQNFNLLNNLTAMENVELPMEAKDVPKEKRKARALELLESVDMADRAEHRPTKLSGGEQQRVAIARALANDPPIILADEPTGSLDSKTGASIMALLDRLRKERGTTVIVVTHSRRAAKECDMTFTIKDGVITSEEDTDALDTIEERKKELRKGLSISGKIVNKLFDAGFDSLDALAKASTSELTGIVGSSNKAEKIVKKAKTLKELQEDVVED